MVGNSVNISECNNYRLKSDPARKDLLYRLVGIKEGVIVPFYSNCLLPELQHFTTATLGYFPFRTVLDPSYHVITETDVHLRHWISSTCYINLEPSWLGFQYWIDMEAITQEVSDIPYGYKINQFTINTKGTLASSLEFLYTSHWAQVYSIQRVSNNNVIVSEVDMLQDDLVLFYLNGSRVVDESNSFFGQGNNGRDCIRKSVDYSFDVTSCFFQNDQTSYTSEEYLTGIIQTTGIARFTSKFTFSLATDPSGFSFTLVPKSSADFNFYIAMNGTVCPKLINFASSTDHCDLTFFYMGNDANIEGNPVTFVNNSATISLKLGLHMMKVSSLSCLLIQCRYSLDVTTILLETPNVTIIRQDDLNLATTIDLSLNGTRERIWALDNSTQQIWTALEEIQQNLSKIDFNTFIDNNPYQNFSELRAEIDRLIQNLDSSGSGGCSGPFSSATCFFQDVGSTLVVILVIAVVYMAITKSGIVTKSKGVRSVELEKV